MGFVSGHRHIEQVTVVRVQSSRAVFSSCVLNDTGQNEEGGEGVH